MNKLDYIKQTNDKRDINEFVSSVITNQQGNVLILKRLNTLKLDPGKYDLCSGHMKANEIPIQAMLRELNEELGINMEDIISYENIGTIKTPHLKFPNTKCHMFHIIINMKTDEINRRIKQVPEIEMDKSEFVENIEELKKILKNTNLFRTLYTDEVEQVLRKIETKLSHNKGVSDRKCEER